MLTLENGVVKWFNVERRFGFVYVEGKDEELFFHYNNASHLCFVKGRLEWCLIPAGKATPMPRPGDRIVFARSSNSQGPIASPWVRKSVYDYAMRRTIQIVYRVMIQYSYHDGSHDPPRVEWEGTDLDDCQLKLVWDPFRDKSTFVCTDFSFVMWFERLEKNTWVKCPDPRDF